ncbi:MAG TPA: LysR family transcriptional regulator [Xanthobacteraceae bacterium]|nr:LysR family transcriptional regulator [Xanthobacteraceae bacterium]
MIDFRLLRHFWYFLAVAEEGHFGKAAQRLGMSQPPLSQQIQLLEKMLGVRLFERSRQGARLTREGAAILAPVQRFMEHAYRLQLTVNDARQGRSDVITMGAINSSLFDVMPGLMRIAKQRYPDLSLSMSEMKSSEALSAVQNGEIDIAFARVDDHVSSLEVRPIVHDHLVLVLPADHRLTALNQVNLADLADEIFVLPPRRSSPSYFDQITSACRAAGFSPQVHFEISSVVSQIAYVGCGVAVGMVPSRSMRFGGSDVVFRRLVETIKVVSIAAAWNPQRRKDLIPEIIAIAENIGADRSALPVRSVAPAPVLERERVPID